MKNKIVAGIVAASILVGVQPKASAVVIGYAAANGATLDEIGNGLLEMYNPKNPGSLWMYLWSGGLLALGGLEALGFMLLDNPTESLAAMSSKIQNYGAEAYEAKNLATLLVNAQIIETKTGKQILITPDQMKLAAPNFVNSDGFSVMLKDLSQQSEAQ